MSKAQPFLYLLKEQCTITSDQHSEIFKTKFKFPILDLRRKGVLILEARIKNMTEIYYDHVSKIQHTGIFPFRKLFLDAQLNYF